MPLRVVIIGTGFGKRRVEPAYLGTGRDVELEVVSPHDAEAIHAAIARPCDLVSIHSPPFLHLEHVRLATRYRRNVLCDKPFGVDVSQAREMLDLATKAGVLHFVNFEFRSDPLRLKIKSLLDSGALGEPVHMISTVFISWGRDLPDRWLFHKGEGGWIGASGSHTVDMLRWFFGEVAALGGQARTEVKMRPDRDPALSRMHPSTAEDAFTAWFRMDSGVTVTLDSAYAASVTVPSQLTIFCSKGAIQVTNQSELTVLRPDRAPESFFFPPDKDDPHQPALGLWLGKVCDAVAERRQIAPSFETGVACVEVLDRLRHAAATREQIDLHTT
jgi:predicted dehydrogenase